MIFNCLKKVTPLALLMTTNLYANSLEEFYKYFQNGQYPKALQSLENFSPKDNVLASKAYLSGLSYSRMQEYDKAIVEFGNAIVQKSQNTDLFYEYGQALYASNELKKARDAFKASADLKYNRPASLYYVAHISQILEEYDMARDFYVMAIRDKTSDAKMRQIAQFQLGETLFSIARLKSNTPAILYRRVDRYILPMITSAYNLDKRSSLAPEINQRISEIMQEFNLDPNVLANDRKISPKRHNLTFSQKVRFDDNISLKNEENDVKETMKSSIIYESGLHASYDFVLKKRYIISPDARITYTKHSNQKDPEVYQNDSIVMNFALKNKYEHKLFDLPASLIFDIDYSTTQKDWQAQKKKEFYAKSTTFTIGESFNYFDFGDTTLKFKRKNFIGANTDINNHSLVFSADQIISLPIQHLVVLLFEANLIDNFNAKASNTNTYLFRTDYIIPEIFHTYTLSTALAVTMTNTKAQKETRGTELSWNPSIDLSKDLTENSKISLNYDYTKSTSDNPEYAYGKSVYTAEFSYSF